MCFSSRCRFLLLLTAASTPAYAQEHGAGRGHGVAIFPTSHAAENAGIVKRLDALLARKASEAGLVTLSGAGLSQRLDAPLRAIERCAGELPCIAKLGRKAQVTTIVHGRARSAAAGVQVDLLVIDLSGKARIESRVTLSFSSKGEVAPALQEAFPMLLGVEYPTDTVDSESIELAAPPPARRPAGSAAYEPEGDPLALVPLEVIAPPATPAPAIERELPALGDGKADELSATSREELTAEPSPRAPWISWLGGSLAGAAALAALGGVACYAQAQARYGEIQPNTDIVRTRDLMREGDAGIDRTNVLFAVGGGLAAAGGALLIWDLVARKNARAALNVDAGGARGTLSFSF